jgi:hypothetical protein
VADDEVVVGVSHQGGESPVLLENSAGLTILRVRHKGSPMCVRLPLTPTLSLREREPRTPSVGQTERPGWLDAQATMLPLPRGEGRGEGKERVLIIQRVVLQPNGAEPVIISSFGLWRKLLILAAGGACISRKGAYGDCRG